MTSKLIERYLEGACTIHGKYIDLDGGSFVLMWDPNSEYGTAFMMLPEEEAMRIGTALAVEAVQKVRAGQSWDDLNRDASWASLYPAGHPDGDKTALDARQNWWREDLTERAKMGDIR